MFPLFCAIQRCVFLHQNYHNRNLFFIVLQVAHAFFRYKRIKKFKFCQFSQNKIIVVSKCIFVSEKRNKTNFTNSCQCLEHYNLLLIAIYHFFKLDGLIDLNCLLRPNCVCMVNSTTCFIHFFSRKICFNCWRFCRRCFTIYIMSFINFPMYVLFPKRTRKQRMV